MLCDRCKSKPASVEFTTVENGVSQCIHLCDGCARESGLLSNPGSLFDGWMQSFLGMPGQKAAAAQPQQKACSRCGLTWSRLQQLGKVGCSQCYRDFRQELQPFLQKVQGGMEHTGKVGASAGEGTKRRQEIAALQQQLQQAIGREDYEGAAKLRDTIKSLQAKA